MKYIISVMFVLIYSVSFSAITVETVETVEKIEIENDIEITISFVFSSSNPVGDVVNFSINEKSTRLVSVFINKIKTRLNGYYGSIYKNSEFSLFLDAGLAIIKMSEGLTLKEHGIKDGSTIIVIEGYYLKYPYIYKLYSQHL